MCATLSISASSILNLTSPLKTIKSKYTFCTPSSPSKSIEYKSDSFVNKNWLMDSTSLSFNLSLLVKIAVSNIQYSEVLFLYFGPSLHFTIIKGWNWLIGVISFASFK